MVGKKTGESNFFNYLFESRNFEERGGAFKVTEESVREEGDMQMRSGVFRGKKAI